MGRWAFAVSFALLLVGLPVGVAFGLAETTGSGWAVLIGIAVTINVSFFLHLLVAGEPEGAVLLGVSIAVLGAFFALVGFHVMGGSWASWVSGTAGAVAGLVGLIVAVVGMVLAMLGVQRSL